MRYGLVGGSTAKLARWRIDSSNAQHSVTRSVYTSSREGVYSLGGHLLLTGALLVELASLFGWNPGPFKSFNERG
jgi:hypothetical protein